MNNQQSLADREQLQARIADNSRQQSELITKRYTLQQNIKEAKNRYDGYLASKSPYHEGKAEPAKQELDRLSAELEKVNAQIEDLQRSIDTDKATVAKFCINVTLAETIDQKNDILEEEKKADDLRRLVAEQQTIIDAAQVLDDTATPLKKQRGQLQAEAATGIDHAKKLADLEAEIAKSEKADRATNQAKIDAAGKAAETKAALENMLASALQTITQKQHSLGLMHDTLLGQMAVEELDNYKAAVQHLVESLRNLAAIDSLIAKIGIRRTAGILPGLANQKITLPALGDMPGINISGVYMSTFNVSAEPANCENLLNRLAEQGIEV